MIVYSDCKHCKLGLSLYLKLNILQSPGLIRFLLLVPNDGKVWLRILSIYDGPGNGLYSLDAIIMKIKFFFMFFHSLIINFTHFILYVRFSHDTVVLLSKKELTSQ